MRDSEEAAGEKHFCVKCKHAFWPWLMPDVARCRKHLKDADQLEPITGKPLTDEHYEYCQKVRKCWGWQIKQFVQPSPTCPDYEPRTKRR